MSSAWGLTTGGRVRGRRSEKAQRAKQRIVDTIEADRLSKGPHSAWGQFLGRPASNRQVGIYGTSAAIQVLAVEPSGAISARDALPTLPGTPFTAKDADAHFDDDDLALTLKCCAVIEAMTALGVPATITDVEELLLSSMLSDANFTTPVPAAELKAFAGWALVTRHAHVRFTEARPDLLATAQVVLALKSSDVVGRIAPSRQREVAAQIAYAMRWAIDQAGSRDDVTPVELAFTLLAAKTYAGDASSLGLSADKLIGQLRAVLKRHLGGRGLRALPRSEPRFYSIATTGGSTENHYTTYPVHLLVSWALADRVDGRLPRQREIFDVCDDLCVSVEAAGAPVSMVTGAKSITDSMYAIHLLRTIAPRLAHLDSNWWRRRGVHMLAVSGTALASVALFIGAVVAGLVSVSTEMPETLRGVATVAVAVLPIPAIWLARVAYKMARRGP